MRTTIDIPDYLFRRLKTRSASQGLTIKKYITRAIEYELEPQGKKSTNKHVEFPLIKSKYPGTINLTSEKISLLLDKEDMDVSS